MSDEDQVMLRTNNLTVDVEPFICVTCGAVTATTGPHGNICIGCLSNTLVTKRARVLELRATVGTLERKIVGLERKKT